MNILDVVVSLGNALDHLSIQRQIVSATLGNGDGTTVKVDDRPGYHWVRLHGRLDERIQALNRATAPVYGLAVWVTVNTERRSGQTTYEVLGLGSNDVLTAGGTVPFDPYLASHHVSHERSAHACGRDPVDIYERAIAPGRVYPTSPASMRCWVAPVEYLYRTYNQRFGGGLTADLAPQVPATGLARLAYICVDGATNALAYQYSGTFPWLTWADPIPASARIAINTGYVLLSAIILYNGLTAIVERNFTYEMRPLFKTIDIVPRTVADAAARIALAATLINADRAGLVLQLDTGTLWVCIAAATLVQIGEATTAAYTPTNVSVDRSYDADSTSTDELADVLGTLIADLQSVGVIQ